MVKKVYLIFFLVGLFQSANCQSDSRDYQIQFDELSLLFKSRDMWSPDSLFNKKHQNSVEIDIGLVESFDDKKFKIITNRDDIKEI